MWLSFLYTHLLTTSMAFLPVYVFINKRYDLPSGMHVYQLTVWPSFWYTCLSTNGMTFLPVYMFINKQYGLPSGLHIYQQTELPSFQYRHLSTNHYLPSRTLFVLKQTLLRSPQHLHWNLCLSLFTDLSVSENVMFYIHLVLT
jgi:hypothetical protein